MSVRDARAPSIALAGVAVAGLLVGGMFFRNAMDGPAGNVVTQRALAATAPRWHDGYHHFILTVAAPLSPVAGRILVASRDQRGDRRPAVTHSAVGAPAPAPAVELTVAIKHSGKGAASAATPGAGTTSAGAAPAGQYSIPWQSVAPNPADPIVLRPGQPFSMLAKALAGFPKGTTLERDSDGNIRAVLPPGWHWVPGRNGNHFRHDKGAGTPKPATPKHHAQPSGPAAGTLPPGWLPDSRAVVASLLRLPDVHSASPVWGTRYQVATTLTAAQLKSVPGVKAVAANNLFAYTSLPDTNDPQLGEEYYAANDGQSVMSQSGTNGASSNFAYAWARSRGSGVVVADIDTGVDLTNPDLAGQILSSSEDFAVSPPSSDVQADGTATGFYHATTVDGVLAGAVGNGWGGAGAAPEAKILALKCGDSDSLSDSCIYAAGEYAISQHVKIINMSFGEQTSSDPTLNSLVEDAYNAGILVTAAAGNWGTDNDTSAVLPANYASTYSNVISVGATDNQDNVPSFSDYGQNSVDLMAPGDNMFTDYPTYTGFDNAYVSGTSYAAPMVAAAAALLWSVDPNLGYTAVKNDILNTVNTTIEPGLSSKCATGGVLNAEAALAQVSEPVQFSFTGFDSVQPEQAASVAVNVSAQAGSLPTGTPLGYHLELIYNYSGSMYDVEDQTLRWTMGSSGTQSVQTASNGSAFIAPSGITSTNYGSNPLDLSVTSPGLPSGTYALVVYAATAAAPSTAIGNPQAVFFNVGQPSPTPAVTTTTSSGGGAASTTTTAGAGSSTTTTGSGTTTTGVPDTTLGTSPLPGVGGGSSTSEPTTTTTTTGGTTTSSTTVPTGTTTTTVAGGTTTTTSGSGTTTTTGAGGTTTTAAGSGTTTTTVAGSGTTTTTVAGGTTTTTAGSGTTTTTASGTTTTTASGPTTTTTASFSIDSVDPNSLPQSGGDVSIFGTNLPANPVVTVGSVDEAVSSASSTEIDVMVGAMTAGNYSVTVYNATQSQSSSLPDALTIGTPSTTTTSSGATTTTAAGGGSTTTTAGSGTTTTTAGGTTTTTASGTTTTTSVSTSTTTGATTTTAATTTTTGSTATTGPGGTVTGPDGMVLSPVSSSDPISTVPVGEWPAFTATQIIADNNASAGSPVDGVDV